MRTMKNKAEQLMHNRQFWEFVRFGINGCLSTAVHVGIYYLLLPWLYVNAAYITGYVVSFIGNFFLTSYFTFRTKPTWKRFFGFAGSHAVNFLIHVALLNLFLFLGFNPKVIPFFVIAIAMVVQFSILRWVFVKH